MLLFPPVASISAKFLIKSLTSTQALFAVERDGLIPGQAAVSGLGGALHASG
jgi:hypothetical protein